MNYLESVIGAVIRRTNHYMEETGRPDSFERFPYLTMLSERFAGDESRLPETESANAPKSDIAGAESANAPKRDFAGDDAHTKQRYESLLRRLSGGEENHVLKIAADLALATALVTEFAAYLNYYTGKCATLQFAYEMSGEFCPNYAEVTEYKRSLGRAFRIESKSLSNYANIEAGHELLSYLAGDGRDGYEFSAGEYFCHETALHPMYVREQMVDEGAGLLKQGALILHICGEGGKRFLVKHIAKRVKKNVLFARIDRVCEEEEDTEELLGLLSREAFLYSCMVCLYEDEQMRIKKEGEQTNERLACVIRSLTDVQISVLLCTRENKNFLVMHGVQKNENLPVIHGIRENENLPVMHGVRESRELSVIHGIWESRELPVMSYADGNGIDVNIGLERQKTFRILLEPLTRAEREKVWKGFAEQYHLKIDTEQCSVKYRMNEREIARAVEEWVSGKIAADRVDGISEICCRMLCVGEKEKLGIVQRPKAGFSDLIVPQVIEQTLKEICCGVLQGHRIYEEWGLEKQYPYGKNISVLLAGAPGTGKTMTAHVLAHETGMPLYQVDLSHVMDKYIGETEKHLEQIFAFAEKANVVLFFDEADAMFGKRGEVTEGKDRYANMEVSYLLQRIEQFDGIVILATNFYHNIDKAFLRRMKYVLKYQEPDEEMRRRMWESCLPPQMQREAMDTDYLARQFAISGGMIKNVVQGACISAVYEKRPLGMEHVLRALRREYEKLERSISPEFWGEYEYLMESPK